MRELLRPGEREHAGVARVRETIAGGNAAAIARDELDARFGGATVRHEARARATFEAVWRPPAAAPRRRGAPIPETLREGQELRLDERWTGLGGRWRGLRPALGCRAEANPAREREEHDDGRGSPTNHASIVLRSAAAGARYP